MFIKKNSYPLLIISLIACFLAFSGWSAMRAIEAGPEVTDVDYYSKGLKYTSTLLEKRAAAVLGWQVETELIKRTLTFHLRDKEGQPVKSAQGQIFLYQTGLVASKQQPLQETEPGLYIFNLTTDMTGAINARIEFEQNGARINRQLLLNL